MKTVKCPQCNNDCEFSLKNHFRPFCSHRCQLIDLGQWVEEQFKIPDIETGSAEEKRESKSSESMKK